MDPHSQGELSSRLSPGPGSPAFRRRNEADIARKDPKYKRYSANIDRALSLFEANALQEWADYISFLGRLLKALQSHPSLPHIPSKGLVAKRLAQCLNARLPSGVHQKTLEVYSYIFSLIGKEGLAEDLTVWTQGLVPVLTYASISVKPFFLSIIETYYVPLGQELRPALKSLILALLPGIDEEGGEYFDRTLDLIQALRTSVGDEVYFWQSFLLATMTSPGKRQGALAWFNRKMPTLDSVEALNSPLVTPEPGMLIRAFIAGLSDDQLLVQRGFLDLLVSHLPLKSPVLQKLVRHPDLQSLLTAAAGVVLRRDMSLNRRLWIWFLGPEASGQATSPITSPATELAEHFKRFGLDPLAKGLRSMIEANPTEPSERAKPYRICLSLMDRWEVGGLVVPQLFSAVVASVKAYEADAPSEESFADVLKSASVFFDGVDPVLIWGEMFKLLHSSLAEGSSDQAALEKLEMARFIVRMFNVREEEMVTKHVPYVAACLLVLLQSSERSKPVLDKALAFESDLLALVPFRTFTKTQRSDARSTIKAGDALESAIAYYSRITRASEANFPLKPLQIASLLVEQGSQVARTALVSDASGTDVRYKVLSDILLLVPKLDNWNNDALLQSVLKAVNSADLKFGKLQGVSCIIAALIEKQYLNKRQVDSLLLPLVQKLWQHLAPERPRYHVEAVKALWNIQDKLLDKRIEAAIARVMTEEDLSSGYVSQSIDQVRRFAVLWTHSISHPQHELMLSRPLFLLLDELANEGSKLHVFARSWMQNLQAPATKKLFGIFVGKLLACGFLHSNKRVKRIYSEQDDLDIATYYFETLANILKYASEKTLDSLATDQISSSENRAAELKDVGLEDEVTYQAFFVRLTMLAVDGHASHTEKATQDRVSRMQRAALSVLHQMVESPQGSLMASMKLENAIINRLIDALNGDDPFLQVSLLDVLYSSLKIGLARTETSSDMKRPSVDGPPKALAKISLHLEREKPAAIAQPAAPPQLVTCLIKGISSKSARPVLDSWINFLIEVLPFLADNIFQVLMELVECVVQQLQKTFDDLKSLYENGEDVEVGKASEQTLVALIHGLEHILAVAHERLVVEESKATVAKPQAEATGFFGNMASGLFAVESPHIKSATANNRLTVLLCFQDTVKICYSIWAWADSATATNKLSEDSLASFKYTSSRMRARSRRILEHMFAVETLECIETLVELWPAKPMPEKPRTQSVFKLINVLDGSRPKHTIPAIFNAIYSRTNPTALEPTKKSTLTAELQDLEVVRFLVEYARSLEDDAMDEIWTDCMTFLRDVLANPFPHRQTLAGLLEFTAIIGEKVDNTNFGEQRKLRKDLADVFVRLLTSMVTVRPPPPPDLADSDSKANSEEDVTRILTRIMPLFSKILQDSDRLLAAVTTVVTSYIQPLQRAKTLPLATLPDTLSLLVAVSNLPGSTFKVWRKEVGDLFSDSKFPSTPLPIIKSHWRGLLKRWVSTDRDKLTDLLFKLTPPTTAGVLFGVGATSARQEADRRTDQTLLRITTLILSSDTDAFLPNLPQLEEKLVELFDATPTSSPSSQTRKHVLLLVRALLLRISSAQLSGFWPILNAELESAFISLCNSDAEDPYADNAPGVLQARKLLDQLLAMELDEFQPYEFLYVRDSIDAVYDPEKKRGVGVVEVVGECEGVDGGTRAWARRLGIEVFEMRYRGETPGGEVIEEGIWGDLFEGKE